MNLAGFLLKSRGVNSLAKRIPGLFVRFGVTERKIASCLHKFTDITELYGARPTFAITANLIPRHPKLIRGLQARGVEFAIHGLVHTDYARLSLDKQRDHIKRAMRIFDSYGVEFSGFRCPYLSSNSDTLLAAGDLGLKWESSDVVSWDVLDLSKYTARQLEAYNKVNELYSAKSISMEKPMPKLINGLVEIPVSIPDDEALVDRLGVRDRFKIAAIWEDILKKSYERGELFTIQLHHERIDFCGMALTRVLEKASSFQPSVWVAQLKEIAEWVIELKSIELRVDQCGERKFKVRADGSKRASVLFKNIKANVESKDWTDGYRLAAENEFEVEAEAIPAVGVSPETPDKTINRLRDEGFIVEVTDSPGRYSYYLDTKEDRESFDDLIEAIEISGKPVIRLWRWPNGARSALSCTGDIDSITIIDFARRFVEV